MTYVVTEYCDGCKYTDCVEECPVEAIYEETDVPEKWESYIKLNEEKCLEFPVIVESKDPLDTAKTLDELRG